MIKAGEAALVSVYNGGICEPINDLRIRRFYDKTTSSTAAVQPHTLPPTAAATKTHSLRVYQQVQVWKGEEDRVPPENWGMACFRWENDANHDRSSSSTPRTP